MRALSVVPLVLVAFAVTAFAGDAAPEAAPKQPAPAKPPKPIEPPGSADDVNFEIDTMRPRQAGILPWGPVSLFDPVIDDLNARLDAAAGLKIGMAYTWAYQRPSDSDLEHKDAMAGDVDLFARWRFFGGEAAPTRGLLGVNGEYRHPFGDDPVPKDLAASYGGVWRSTNSFGTQEVMLTQCWWEQHLAGDRVVVTVGKMDADNFYNKYRYQSDSMAFLSQAFSSNPARKHPGNGLGVNALVKTAADWYVTAGAQDANGDKDKSGFHTIDEGDFFGAAEVGWTPAFEGMGKGAYRLTAWGIEKATIAGTPADHGVALSCEQELCKGYVPFFRAAWSNGKATGVSRFAAAGVGFEGMVLGGDDLTGIAVAWGQPEDHDARHQFGAEVFHRFQLAPDVQLTVGYQYIVDPSFAPSSDHDPVGVFEVRVRIEF